MSSAEEQTKTVGSTSAAMLLGETKFLGEAQGKDGAKKAINSELWHACAGPLVSLPPAGSIVYYFPQGHSEQVAATTRKTSNSHFPNYPNLPSQLMCQVHDVTLHADKDNDEIYAQMTLQAVKSESDIFPILNQGPIMSKHPTEFFCKNLTASDTSTHGGFSVPRRAAEKLFPQLDYSMQPPNQELIVRDLHDNVWTFRHIYRGQPKRHLLTTGWSLFVGAKRLKAGDSVLFIRDEKSQLLVGVRRANRQHSSLPSSVLSSESMHIGVLAAAAHAAASRSPFTIYYNPRTSPSAFVIPLAKYHKAAYTQVSVGMRFGMMFETEESSKRRYMGTIAGINDYDSVRWPNSKWRNLQVEWDEHGCGERPERVSLWEIETPESLFVYPSPSPTPNSKRQCTWGYADCGLSATSLVVPGWDIITTFPKTLENAQNNFNHLSTVGSELVMKFLNQPENPVVTHLGCRQSIYASIVQNIKSNCIARPYSTLPTSNTITSAINGDLLTKAAMQPAQQRILPENNAQLESQENNAGLMCTSELHVNTQLPCNVESLPNQKLERSTNTLSNGTSSVKSDLASVPSENQDELCHKEDGTSDQSLSEYVNNQSSTNCSFQSLVSPAIGTEEWNHKESSDTQLGRHLEPICVPSPELETHQESLPHFLYNTDWMVQHSCFQDFNGMSQLLAVDDRSDSALSSTGLSSVMNRQTFDLTETFRSSCISNSQTLQCLPDSIQGGPDISPLSFLSTAEVQAIQQEGTTFQCIDNSYMMKDLPEDNNSRCEIFGDLHFDTDNRNILLQPATETLDVGVLSESGVLMHISKELQSHITSTSLTAIPDSSGGASSGSFDATEHSLNRGPRKHVTQHPLRTYTKVQKLGSVGRSIDVTRFRDYRDLRSAIACLFGLEGKLDDPSSSEWKLVYVDYENDVLLVGDDPWEEFISCVKCIRVLSPSEVQQMSQAGMQFTSSFSQLGSLPSAC